MRERERGIRHPLSTLPTTIPWLIWLLSKEKGQKRNWGTFSPFISMREIFSLQSLDSKLFLQFFLSSFDFSLIFPQPTFCSQLDMTIYLFFVSNFLSSVKCHPTRCPLTHSLTVFGMEFPGRICQGSRVKEGRKKSTEPAVTCDFNKNSILSLFLFLSFRT